MANQTEIAEHLDLTSRHVRNLLKDGVLPPSKPGAKGYDLKDCRVAYIRYLRGVSSGQIKPTNGQSEDDFENQDNRDKLEYEKWREKKRENDLAECLVAPISTLSDALQKVSTQIVPILEALPLEMKRRNPQLTGHDIMVVKKSIAGCRNIISAIQIVDDDQD